jgi:hypothetical protein
VSGTTGAEHCVAGHCTRCGLSHREADRRARLVRALPETREVLVERWPCLYGGASGARQLQRDLRAVGARIGKIGVWTQEACA